MKTQLAHTLKQTEESYKGIHPTEQHRADGWHIWYAQWLLMLSDIASLLGYRPTSRELEQLLLKCDHLYQQTDKSEQWHDFMAERLLAMTKSKKS